MILKEFKTLDEITKEYGNLIKRSILLDEILQLWDKETLTFNCKPYNKSNRLSTEKLKQVPKSKGHFIMKKMHDLLSYEESYQLIDYEELDKKVGDE